MNALRTLSLQDWIPVFALFGILAMAGAFTWHQHQCKRKLDDRPELLRTYQDIVTDHMVDLSEVLVPLIVILCSAAFRHSLEEVLTGNEVSLATIVVLAQLLRRLYGDQLERNASASTAFRTRAHRRFFSVLILLVVSLVFAVGNELGDDHMHLIVAMPRLALFFASMYFFLKWGSASGLGIAATARTAGRD